MKFNIKKTLASIVLVSAVGLSGCAKYAISQTGVDAIAERPLEDWVEYTDNSMNVHQLIQERRYEEAKSALEEYLRQQVRVGVEYKGGIEVTDKVSKPAVKRIGKTIDTQIQKIDSYLK